MNLNDRISDQVNRVPRSGIRDFFELVIGRDDVISLGVGEPDYAAPWHIREAAIYSLEKGMTSYTSNLGLLSLRQEISKYVEKQFGVEYDPETEVLITVGVSEALDLACRAILNPGDEVIYHEPCYVSYSPSVIMAYGQAVPVATAAEDGFALKAGTLSEVLTPKSKALMLNFPTNPTGGTLSRADVQEISEFAVENDLLVLTDEIYSELLYDGETHYSVAAEPGMRERTILFHGFSKAFAMTGFRLGYACGPPPLIEAMMKIHQYSMLCAPITSQMAALEALRNGEPAMKKMRDSYAMRRRTLLDGFEEIGVPCPEPKGAFYAFPDVSGTGLSSKEFATRLLEEKNVAAVPGDAFGPSGEGHLRCCYATALEKLRIALEKMGELVTDIGKEGS
ncbi:MAG: aminotransferase class I/II-fold pyridoxal phosphate-dependent enzyme [Verrucomicrobiota bacterium]